MNRKWELLPPRPILAPLKQVESATTSVHALPDGRLECQISHAPIRGVTPQMVEWWFRSIGGDITIGGTTWPRYLVWHPLDHIHWSLERSAPDGTVGAGARFHIVEAFGQNLDYLLDAVTDVRQLDGTGIVLTEDRFGSEIMRLHHTWSSHPEGTQYDSHLVVGMDSSLGQLFNRFARTRLFPEEMARAWIKHNVEEVGNLENFLPQLHAEAATTTVAAS